MRVFILSLFCSFFSLSLFAQEDSEGVKYSRWNINPSVGYQFAPIYQNKDSDVGDFYSASSSAFCWQVISADVFFRRQWGFSFSVPMYSVSDGTYESGAKTLLNKKFGDDKYYFNELTKGKSSSEFLTRILVGPTYRVERDKLYFQAKLLFGMSEFSMDNLDVYLKEKNSNFTNHYSLEAQPNLSTCFTFSPSLLAGYRVYERFVLNLNLQYYVFKTDATVIETFTDLYANESTETRYKFNSYVNVFSLSFGVIFEFSRKYRDH